MTSPFIVECLDCGHRSPYVITENHCINCGSDWRETRYDLESLKADLPALWKDRPFDLWRYRELLPVIAHVPDISLGEGGTPLLRAANLGMMLGLPKLYIKDERQGPTASFKDRQAAVTIAALKEAGVTEAVIASTGNVAIAYSAYAARAGIKLWAFITSLVPQVKMREVALYGTQVVKVTGNYDQAKQIAAEFAKTRALYVDRGVRSITTVDAMKTLAFEMAEQLTAILGPPESGAVPWRTPDWYVQAVSGGLGPVGVLKGFEEMKALGLVDRSPKIANLQADGCAPMVSAWKANKEKADPVINPRTHIATLATGDPGRTYTVLRQRMLDNAGGLFEEVSDEEAFRAMHIVAKMEGMSVEPASAVAFAGLIKLVRAGAINPNEVVVVNLTGHTVPVEQSVLGENWARSVDYPEKKGKTGELAPEEGLLAALNRVSADRYRRVAIIDDNPDVRQLIRRILQAQGNYTLFEAQDGRAGVELINREKPDLIILDLMMPEMDGFSVLEVLRHNPDTAEIPVIVATAKELSNLEKERLGGQIQALMQKGDFMSDELLAEVKKLIE
ncbi:MAG: pyridoxal-phosphate dependent enzyme [Anaerolineae bacterium]|nr:MAG: pyridoxal-phosphate dependent enzyme [Anaerolineae bacterium]